MKKRIFYIFFLVMMLLLTGCASVNEPDGALENAGGEASGGEDTDNNSENNGTSGVTPKNDAFVLKATVSSAEEAGRLLVEVIESDYAFGPYWVLVGGDTLFLDSSGKVIAQSEICVGDTIEITYGGQVMMSYPPQIVASKVQKLGAN